jgi:pyruvate/2-oxoglutarate dehydrogenase complex dihydrolipoamide dehydrogenase (E3) component
VGGEFSNDTPEGRLRDTGRRGKVKETSWARSRAPTFVIARTAWVFMDGQLLVGDTFVGPDVAELLHSATTAIVGGVPLHRLRHAVPAYPTITEVWLRMLESPLLKG